MNIIEERKKHIFSLLKEAEGEEKSTLEKKINDIISKDLSVTIEKQNYSENKDANSIQYSFIIPTETTNIYIDLRYGDNTLKLYMNFDERDKEQLKSVENNKMVIYPKSVELTESVVNLLTKLQRSVDTSIKELINTEFIK